MPLAPYPIRAIHSNAGLLLVDNLHLMLSERDQRWTRRSEPTFFNNRNDLRFHRLSQLPISVPERAYPELLPQDRFAAQRLIELEVESRTGAGYDAPNAGGNLISTRSLNGQPAANRRRDEP
jgi:hypothetical protein